MTIGLKNMKRNRKNIVIIGEGLTEFYYFNSLRQSYRQLQIRPVYPHHSSSMEELELEIDKAVDDGCPYIVCVVDMDNKKDEKEKWAYERLKKRKEGKHWIRKKGLEYEIRFIETEPCTELFFLFYFIYTTHHFGHQPELLHELNKHCLYEKKESFFRKHPLHQYFEKSGGDFMQALRNAAQSMKEKEETDRDYTYSQMAELFDALGIKAN